MLAARLKLDERYISLHFLEFFVVNTFNQHRNKNSLRPVIFRCGSDLHIHQSSRSDLVMSIDTQSPYSVCQKRSTSVIKSIRWSKVSLFLQRSLDFAFSRQMRCLELLGGFYRMERVRMDSLNSPGALILMVYRSWASKTAFWTKSEGYLATA